MALGCCPVCDRLVPIVAGAWFEKPTATTGGRREWHPVAHDAGATHAGCGGEVVDLAPVGGGDKIRECTRCGRLSLDLEGLVVDEGGLPCAGRVIR